MVIAFWISFSSCAGLMPCGGPRIIICEPSKYESQFLAVSFPVNELVYFSFSEILSSAS